MGFKSWGVQLCGLLVKTFTQRLRSPIITAVEVLLPCAFTLFLAICYWLSDTETVPAAMYEGDSLVPMNMSLFAERYLCTMPGSTLRTTWPECNMMVGRYQCLSNVGNGNDLCASPENYAKLSKVLYSMYFGSGPFTTNTMDGHLSLSAMVREATDTEQPTFFGRGGKASLSHYGKLLVSSDSAGLAGEFMKFCQEQSGMCKEVLHPTAFSTVSEAEEYALAHENHVWAIVDLPASILTAQEQGEFTISMNYTATPWTFSSGQQNPFFRGLGNNKGGDGYILYWTSGFMTLQTFVQEFFLQRHVKSGVPQTGGATYASVHGYMSEFGAGVIPMPTPSRYDNGFLTEWGYYIPLVAVLAALFPVARLTALIVEEKHKGIREAMLVMGLHQSCLFGGWYVSALAVDIVASLLAAMVLKVGFLHYARYDILLVLYFTFMQQNTALAIMLSALFSNPRVAGWSAAFIVFLCSMPTYVFPEGMSVASKTAVTLFPCVGYGEVVKQMTEYASYGQLFTWEVARGGAYSTTVAIGMMWASMAIMTVLALYLDRVWPAAVGRRAHPLFFLAPLLRCCRSKKVEMVRMTTPPGGRAPDEDGVVPSSTEEDVKNNRESLIEHRDDVVDPMDSTIAAVFGRLRKVYVCGGLFGFLYTLLMGRFRVGDRCVALDDVTFAMRAGEVSVLLGPNGAGKSTVMGIATGMIRPTSGKVYIQGTNAGWDLGKARQSIGYCPQSDIVWPSLTVEEHLTLYARLKGSTTLDVQAAVDCAVELINLEEKRHSLAGRLSGGQRRRLCVAIALIGDSSVLFLDEPTAGMDVKGRKLVHTALNRSRAGRSVLISTHLLEEADSIGDHVLVMNEGRLCGEGSSMFLKSKVSAGYIVTCVMESGLPEEEESEAVDALVAFVREKGYSGHHPNEGDDQAVLVVPPACSLLGVQRRGREITFRFPLALLLTSGRELLSQIQGHRAELRVQSVGLSLTTLADVLASVTQGSLATKEGVTMGEPALWESKDTDAPWRETLACGDDARYVESNAFVVFARHFRALFIKRLHFAKRDVKLLVFQVVLPVVFLLLALLVNLVRAPGQPSLVLDATMYPNYDTNPSQVLFSYARLLPNAFSVSSRTPGEAFGAHYSSMLVPASMKSTNGTHAISIKLKDELMSHVMPRHIAVGTSGYVFQPGLPIAASAVLHNTSAEHAAPQALSALYNLASYQIFGKQVPQLVVRNRPMRIGRFEEDLVEAAKQVMVGVFILLPFVLIPSNTISYIVREKESGARHLQWLSGTSASAYWLSSFAFDALCYIGTEILAFAIFAAFHRTEYIGGRMLAPSVLLFFLFGISSIPVSYVLSFFFRSPFTAQSVVLLVNFVFGFLWVLVVSMLPSSALGFVKGASYVLRVLPSVSFGEGMFVISGNALASMMFPATVRPNMFAFLQFKEGGGYTGGIGTSLVYMACALVASCIVLVVLEYLRIQRLSRHVSACCAGGVPGRGDDNEEDDSTCVRIGEDSVVAEEQRVCSVKGGPAEDCIAVQKLSKHYPRARRAALTDVSLGVHKGEVLALLGLNGAGKSTLVSIVANETVPSRGEAYVNHVSVESPSSRRFVGYCPQYDALLDNLTPVEHLWLYSRLRGMREELIAEEVRVLVEGLGLYPHRAQAAYALSGGNRRRLSLAIALVGCTTSILLDEPTTGMDAVARAQTCRMVSRLAKGKSVVLTTHLMDEVEALADRVAFMARGQLQYVGTPQELRSRSTGESVYIAKFLFPRTVDLLGVDDAVPERLRAHMEAAVSGVTATKVQEVRSRSVALIVQGDLPAICDAVAGLRKGVLEGLPPMDFVSVSQPTLEDILLSE